MYYAVVIGEPKTAQGIIVKRRTYLAAFGSAAAGAAGAIGSGASVAVWADRDASISIVSDSEGMLRLTSGEENGQFTSSEGGSLSVDVSSENGAGLNTDARTVIDDIFRIQNQSGSDQVVWIKDPVDDQEELFGDEGPLHFFRGPVSVTDDSGNGILGARRRVFSQLDPVPGTPDAEQRLTVVGLVPPKANIGTDPSNGQRKAWINAGHPVTVVKNGEPAISDTDRRAVGDATNIGNNVFQNDGVVVGKEKGRYFLTSGEQMKIGLAADFSGFNEDTERFELGQVLNKIEIVGRSLEDAKKLATGGTEFNTIP